MKNLIVILLCLYFCFYTVFSQYGTPKEITYNLSPFTVMSPAYSQDKLSRSIFIPNENAVPRGITASSIFQQKFNVAGQAEKYNPVSQNKPSQTVIEQPQDDYWKFYDSINIHSYVPAGANFGVRINLSGKKLTLVTPFNLADETKAAILKSPKWLRPTLEYTLSQLSTFRQKKIVDVINQASDPYIDEIAYAIAYSTPEYLSSNYCNPQMFVDNAKMMYEYDKVLNYVDIMDYGSSSTDENYYSTVRYWRKDTTGKRVQVEVPKEIYYMNIVHPKTTDEIAAYIDSSKVESAYDNTSHVFNIVSPPDGKFWRDYLWRHTEINNDSLQTYYPILKDSITKCDVLWDDTDSSRQAIKEITKWIKSVMNFTSKQERPHQPIRIYTLHIGRCGEWEDLTDATARTCLIPCRGIETISSDHVWNEFWDNEWCQWEPVNTCYKNKLVYSNGWGKKFGSVFMHQSNGVFTSVTNQYCQHTSILNIYALDKDKKPIDGARIMLAVLGTLDSSNIYISSYGITDNEGKCSFFVDKGLNFYARMDSPIGNNPVSQNSVLSLIDNIPEGKEYNYQIQAAGSMPANNYTTLVTQDTLKNYLLKVNYTAEKQVINWTNYFDDMNNTNTILENDNGKINFFIADEDNFNQCNSKQSFSAYLPSISTASGTEQFYAPEDKPWYAFLNNTNSLRNPVLINATFSLYISPTVSVENKITISKNELFDNNPNPVLKSTNISFSLNEDSRIRLNIFNSQGILIKQIADNYFSSGYYTFTWDGTGDKGFIVSPGVYFCQLNTGKEIITKKLIVVK